MAITLVEFWQQDSNTHQAARTAAQNDLANAQLAVAAAKVTLDADVAAAEKLRADIADNRAKLPTTSVPSAVAALNLTIRDQIIKHRALQGSILDDQEAVATAQADANAATAAVNRASARLAESEARLAAANEASKERQRLKTQLAAAPFDTLQADALAATTSVAATDAKDTIDANIPDELQTIAAKRHATRAARAADLRQAVIDAEKALGASLAGGSGLAGTAAQKATEFRGAEQALRDYVTTAKRRYDRAIAVFAQLQAIKNDSKLPDLLTAQEKLDAAATSSRTTAEGKAEAIDTARNAVYAARKALDAQIVTQIGTDVDKLATDPGVKSKRDAVTAKVTALKKAGDDFATSGDRKILDEWEVIIQDPAWTTLIDALDASATLGELKATAPGTLATALDAAENAYAAALAAAAKAQRRADALADVAAQRAERLAASSAAFPARLLSAVRGDSF